MMYIKRCIEWILQYKLYGNVTLQFAVEALFTKWNYQYKGLKFDVHLTDHCNLNCKSCSHFSPLADVKFADVSKFEKDIARVSYLFPSKKVFKILLLGGEPLLHPDVIKFIFITYKYFPLAERQLVTNGILLLRKEDYFWNVCSKTSTTIYITNYPITLNIKEIKAKAVIHHVKIEIEPEIKEFKKYSFDLSGNQNKILNYLFCGDARRCAQLREGKFYACHQVAYIHHLNKYFGYNMSKVKQDYIDIYATESYKDILKYLRTPLPFCKYCDLKNRSFNCIWGISKKEKQEWPSS